MYVCMCHDSYIIPGALRAKLHSECQRQLVGSTEQHCGKGAGGVGGSSQQPPEKSQPQINVCPQPCVREEWTQL